MTAGNRNSVLEALLTFQNFILSQPGMKSPGWFTGLIYEIGIRCF